MAVISGAQTVSDGRRFPHLEGSEVRHPGWPGGRWHSQEEGREGGVSLQPLRGPPPQDGLMAPSPGEIQAKVEVGVTAGSGRFKSCPIWLI